MKKIILSIIAALTVFAVIKACGSHSKERDDTDATAASSDTLRGFTIKGHDDIPMRTGPGDNYSRVVNEKSTKIMGKTQYCDAAFPERFEVLETKDDWSKIQIVDTALSQYSGWIPSKHLLNKAEEQKRFLTKLDTNEYQVLKVIRKYEVPQVHLLMKRKKFDMDYVYYFNKAYSKQECNGPCNIFVYDSKVIMPLIDQDKLADNDYLTMADHLIATYVPDFDVEEWYPYQDFKYKKLGGKNFKRDL